MFTLFNNFECLSSLNISQRVCHRLSEHQFRGWDYTSIRKRDWEAQRQKVCGGQAEFKQSLTLCP